MDNSRVIQCDIRGITQRRRGAEALRIPKLATGDSLKRPKTEY